MAEQLELLETFTAQEIAHTLQIALQEGGNEIATLIAFHKAMQTYPVVSYKQLTITGLGILHEAFVWKLNDNSNLIVGWVSDEEIVVGVLPPDATITLVPHENGIPHTLH